MIKLSQKGRDDAAVIIAAAAKQMALTRIIRIQRIVRFLNIISSALQYNSIIYGV